MENSPGKVMLATPVEQGNRIVLTVLSLVIALSGISTAILGRRITVQYSASRRSLDGAFYQRWLALVHNQSTS